ncbi:MAG: hypothetical protein K9G59_15195 [Caulobacter sp.]|nr:hypothetical protein [Caulobacter sp.]
MTALTSSDVPETQRGGAAADRAFRLHCLDRDNTNLNLFKHRDWQGFMVTGQHSGTHWIKWMLSLALAHQYGLEPPRYMNNPLVERLHRASETQAETSRPAARGEHPFDPAQRRPVGLAARSGAPAALRRGRARHP